MNKKLIRLIAANIDEFEELCRETARIYMQMTGKKFKYIEHIEHDGGHSMRIEYNAAACGCCYDGDYEYMPYSYLWDDDWKEEAMETIREREEMEKQKKEEAAAKAKKLQEEKEREEFLRLKEKYG